MLRFRGKVQYADGVETEFATGTAALAHYEEYALRHHWPIGDGMPPTLGALLMAHYALGIAEGFDTWRQTVAGVELEADGVPPTPPDPSAG